LPKSFILESSAPLRVLAPSLRSSFSLVWFLRYGRRAALLSHVPLFTFTYRPPSSALSEATSLPKVITVALFPRPIPFLTPDASCRQDRVLPRISCPDQQLTRFQSSTFRGLPSWRLCPFFVFFRFGGVSVNDLSGIMSTTLRHVHSGHSPRYSCCSRSTRDGHTKMACQRQSSSGFLASKIPPVTFHTSTDFPLALCKIPLKKTPLFFLPPFRTF